MPEREEVRHWPVLAWIRLKLPEAPAPIQLTRGPPPPPNPPLDLLEPEAIPTDPTVRMYTFSEPLGSGMVRLVWLASEPEALLAEYREPEILPRLPDETVRRFWATVKARVSELGPLPVVAADPRPSTR
jgi:hypothetical protein